MPLSELSAGHIGRNGAAIETPPDSDTSDTGKRAAQFRTPSGVARTAALPTPSSVQSMLKNRTETGDVGELALRSNRKISSTQRLSPPRLSSSVPPSASKRTYRYHDEAHRTPNEHGMSHDLSTYHSLGRTNGGSASTFIYRNRSQTSAGTHHRGPSRGSELGDGRSYAMMQSSSTIHNIPRRPTHINGHLRSPGDPRGMRPRSPLVYPTRLKRPGYRPSSPSLTEVYRSGSRSPFGMNRGTSFRTASPLSTYSAGGLPRRWPQGANRSDPVLASPQLPLNARNHNGHYFEAVARRPFEVPRAHTRLPTPIHAESLGTPNSTVQRIQAAPSAPPLFYDYSEQFQQELNYNIPLAEEIPRTTDVLDEDYMRDLHQSPNDLAPDELLPVDTRMPRSRIRGLRDSGHVGHASATKVSERGMIGHPNLMSWNGLDPDIEQTYADTSIGHVSSSPKGPASNSGRVDSSRPMPQDLSGTVGDTTGHHRFSSYRRGREDPAAAFEHPIAEMNGVPFDQRSPSNSSNNSAQESSNRKSHQFRPNVGISPSAHNSVRAQELYVPEADAAKFSFESERAYVKRLSHHENGSATVGSQVFFRVPSQTDHSKIHSPVPRRSLSSPSNRSRFSSILSIDEGFEEPNEPGGVRHSISPTPENLTPSIPISSRPGPSRHTSGYRHDPPKVNGMADAIEAEQRTDVESKKDTNPYGLTCEVQAQDDLAETQTIREIYMKAKASEADTPGVYHFKGQSAPVKHEQLPVQVRSLPSDANTAVHHSDVAPAPSNKVVRTMKELPPLPRSSIVSVAPPSGQTATPLPFSFTALRPEGKEETDSVTELGKLAASYLDHLDRVGTQTPTNPHKVTSRAHSDNSSSPVRPSSRPWNSEEYYPWSDWKQQLEIAVPTSNPSDTEILVRTKAPRFKLKLHRSSPSATTAVRFTEPRQSDEVSNVQRQNSTGQRFSTSSDIFQTTPFGRKIRLNPLVNKTPGQINSSRASPTPLNTRFFESFDLPASDFMFQTAPSLTLVPPSPGLNLEARSFFSDDSSQMQPKGSLRKRLSQLKATVIRSSTSDDDKGADRALLGSAIKPRGSGRNSHDNERSQRAVGITHQNDTTKWRLVEKVKTWFLHLVTRKA